MSSMPALSARSASMRAFVRWAGPRKLRAASTDLIVPERVFRDTWIIDQVNLVRCAPREINGTFINAHAMLTAGADDGDAGWFDGAGPAHREDGVHFPLPWTPSCCVTDGTVDVEGRARTRESVMNFDEMLDYRDAYLFDAGIGPDMAIDELSKRDSSWLERVDQEFSAGFRLMEDRGPCVTVFGSARIRPGTPMYQQGREVGRELARAGFTVVTGGGPGLMEAANRGALEAGGISIGLGITLNELEPPNRYTTAAITFRYFFVRKVLLVKYATAFVLLPGGLGTLDELFETLNLMQTRKIAPFPVILVGSDHWRGLIDWMGDSLFDTRMVSSDSMNLFLLEDDPRVVAQTIKRWTETHDAASLEQTPAVRRPPRRTSA
jgi:uncharacterized protein (TIGR00730 family)